MPDISAILGLPYLLPSQAQKHVTHNEALRLLDILVQLSVEALDADTPPPVPAEGAVYALGPAPVGAWAGQPGQIAAFVEGATEPAGATILAALDSWVPGDALIIVTAGALKPASKLRKAFEAHPNAYAAAIYDNMDAFRAENAHARQIVPERSLELRIPLHPGAEAYFSK